MCSSTGRFQVCLLFLGVIAQFTLAGCGPERRLGSRPDETEGDEPEGGELAEGEAAEEGEGEPEEGVGEAEGQAPGEGEGEGALVLPACVDLDGDRYGEGHDCLGQDCNDDDALINPGVSEDCLTLYDDNCNEQANEGCSPAGPNCEDEDRDGFGVGDDCYGRDCDDTRAGVYPDAREVCDDRLDNNCDGRTDDGCGAGGRGTDCATMYDCIVDCWDVPCTNECQAHGSSAAREQYLTMQRCFETECATVPSEEFAACAYRACQTEIDNCLGAGW